MKTITAAATLLATPVFAHPGHVTESAGHGHWEIAVVIAAIGLVAWLALRGRA